MQKCEALAIKGALQEMEEGGVAHIHTDSKVTVQALRTMMSGAYRKIRNIGNLQVFMDIVDLVQIKGIKVIVEWVKAHEVYMGEGRSWVNQYKETGNQWADDEAKKQVQEGNIGGEERGWVLRDLLSSKEMDIRVLPKLVQMKVKKERQERLAVPSSQGATHGQGVYVREFVRGSAKCMGVLIRKLRNTSEHYHVLQFAMDRYATRDRVDR